MSQKNNFIAILIYSPQSPALTTKFNHIFYLRKPKSYSSGPVDIYLRITVNGKRTEISTNRSVDPSKWISKAFKVKGHSEDARILNAHLDALQNTALL